MTVKPRIKTITFPTQDYVSRQHGDATIDGYVTEPAQGVTDQTGFLLLIHGWGNDGSVSYEEESIEFADLFDLVVTRVEYRDCGREAHHPEPGVTFDRPYDFSKLQTIDALRAAKATLDRYPDLDRTRMMLWGGSQGAQIAAQCLVFAPTLWSAAVLCCGLYHPYTFDRQQEDGYAFDMVHYPGSGFIRVCAWGRSSRLAAARNRYPKSEAKCPSHAVRCANCFDSRNPGRQCRYSPCG